MAGFSVGLLNPSHPLAAASPTNAIIAEVPHQALPGKCVSGLNLCSMDAQTTWGCFVACARGTWQRGPAALGLCNLIALSLLTT